MPVDVKQGGGHHLLAYCLGGDSWVLTCLGQDFGRVAKHRLNLRRLELAQVDPDDHSPDFVAVAGSH